MPGQGTMQPEGGGLCPEPPFAGLMDNEVGAPPSTVNHVDESLEAFKRRRATIIHASFIAVLGAVYIACSAGLIAFNKYLMHKDRFPYSAVLVLIHTAFSSGLCGLLYLCKPSFFPSLTDPAKKVPVDRDLILKGALPIAFFFAVQLVLSNTAYLHSSVAFLQMMKEANLVMVYSLSLMAALETFSWQNFRVLIFVLFATSLTIHGEMNFSLVGFAIQGASQLFECSKIVLQGVLLAGKKLDPLAYCLLVMPVCFLFLGGFLAVTAVVAPGHALLHPSLQTMIEWAPLLALNALLAFALNLAIAWFLKECTPVAFILAGMLKDAMIVTAGCVLFQEVVTSLQAFGFILQLSAVGLWSLMKSFPQKFDGGIMEGLTEMAYDCCGAKVPLKGASCGIKGYSALEQQASKC